MKLILMGTGPFAVPAFDAIRDSDHEIVAVVTKPEPPVKSRKGPPPSPVRQWATEHALPIHQPVTINDSQIIATLSPLQADLLVVCDYGHILKPAALAIGRLGGINLHGSLLPAYRGAAPVQRALLSGDAETGVSVIHMTPRLDGGPIIAAGSTPIKDDETAGELEIRLSEIGVPLVMNSLDRLAAWDGTTSLGTVQDSAAITKAPRLNKAEAEIDWDRENRLISCHVRGMQPWPIAFGRLPIHENKPPLRVAVLNVTPIDQSDSELSSGQITGGKQLIVRTRDGLMRIETIRPAGKRDMTGEEFQRGYSLPRGTAFVATAQTP